ncbi:hypothetical protein GCM10023189_32360 [Nibrella saemangeumensis]|uniref:Uncharacterized protein n=1 Tax=Nibrella saemangeumensis TaxID=1084526 RepID=A0ABP8N368_9BACT
MKKPSQPVISGGCEEFETLLLQYIALVHQWYPDLGQPCLVERNGLLQVTLNSPELPLVE